MRASEVQRAFSAVRSIASAIGLAVDDTVVLQNSNKLTLHLLPCDVLARIAPSAHQVAQLELELAQRLAETGCPAAALDPRVERRAYEQDGFVVTWWTYYSSAASDLAPADYAEALARLHAGMRKIDVGTPHFTDRVSEAQHLVENLDQSPALSDADREFLGSMLKSLRQTVVDSGAAEQLLHGEPHPGNVLSTKNGPLFIDLETCCRGPIEFDLAHVPEAVIEHYPGVDGALLAVCRALVLAMVASWRWDASDEFPNGKKWAQHLISTLRNGPPWPSLDDLAGQLAGA